MVVPGCAVVTMLLSLRKSEVGTVASKGAKNSVNSFASPASTVMGVPFISTANGSVIPPAR